MKLLLTITLIVASSAKRRNDPILETLRHAAKSSKRYGDFESPCDENFSSTCNAALSVNYDNKVAICHYGDDGPETICVNKRAAANHLKRHSQDHCGECPVMSCPCTSGVDGWADSLASISGSECFFDGGDFFTIELDDDRVIGAVGNSELNACGFVLGEQLNITPQEAEQCMSFVESFATTTNLSVCPDPN